jgi:MFS family permease
LDRGVPNDPAVEPRAARVDDVGARRRPAPVPGDPRSWRRPALITASVFLLNATMIATWVARLPATRDRLDLDARTIGLTLLMSGLGSLVAMPFIGKLAARWSSRPVIVVTALLCGSMLVAGAFTPNAVTTGAALFVFGAALGSWDVAMNIQGSYVDRRAGRDYMPRYHATWSLGAAVGAGVGALMAGAGVGVGIHFTVVAVSACVGSALLAAFCFLDDREPVQPPAAEPSDDDEPQHRGPLLSRRLVLIGVITLCGCLLEGAAADWIALYLTDERAATAELAALGYGMWATAMAVSRFSGTTLIERFGRVGAVRLAGAVVLVGVVATLAAPGVWGAMIGVLFWGAGVALVFPAAMSAGGETPGRAADGIATVSTIGYGGFLVGPPLIGLLAHEIGLGAALWVLPVLALGIVLLSPSVAPLKRQPA